MFKLTRPCVNCPFRKSVARTFSLGESRIREIAEAVAFQCHKTVDYSGEEPEKGDHPQQCAGLMAMLHRAGQPNQIMQVGERLGGFSPARLDLEDTFASVEEAIEAHN